MISRNKIELILGGLLAILWIVMLSVSGVKIKNLQKELDKYKNAPADTTGTYQKDTNTVNYPEIIKEYESEKEKVAIEIRQLRYQLAKALNMPPDSVFLHDTTIKYIELPRTYKVYADTNYRAVVSGVQPRLDSIQTYNTTITQTITKYVTVTPKIPFLQGIAGFSGAKEIGGDDYLAGVNAGIVIKDKYVLKAEYQRGINSKKDYVGASFAVKF